ncbi:MAG: hypothetical protein IH851_10145, partial [Armatimonadetes bacterium]|nr:hypothetical protein [Armatimonadota bacterium]
MIGILATILLVPQGQVVPVVPYVAGQEWFYPADYHVVYVEKLTQADVVAIVRPVSRTHSERRPLIDLATGHAPGEAYVASDTVRVIQCAVGGLSGSVRSVFPHGLTPGPTGRFQGLPTPDPSGNYLLIAKKPVENRAVFPELSRKFGETARQWSVPVRNPDEVAGYVLLRTGKSRVHASEDRKEMILLSVAEALDGASDKSARHIT